MRDRLQVCHICKGYEGTLREKMQGNTTFVSPLALLAHWYFPARGIHIFVYSHRGLTVYLIFATVTEGTPLDPLV